MRKKLSKNVSLVAELVDDQLVIKIGYETLVYAVSHRYDLEYRPYSVTDYEGFTKDILREILRENEIGESPLTKLFDDAADRAADNGSVAVKHKKHKK